MKGKHNEEVTKAWQPHLDVLWDSYCKGAAQQWLAWPALAVFDCQWQPFTFNDDSRHNFVCSGFFFNVMVYFHTQSDSNAVVTQVWDGPKYHLTHFPISVFHGEETLWTSLWKFCRGTINSRSPSFSNWDIKWQKPSYCIFSIIHTLSLYSIILLNLSERRACERRNVKRFKLVTSSAISTFILRAFTSWSFVYTSGNNDAVYGFNRAWWIFFSQWWTHKKRIPPPHFAWYHDVCLALFSASLFFLSYTESHKVWAAGTHNPWFSPAAPSQVCLLMIFPTFSCFLSPCLTI